MNANSIGMQQFSPGGGSNIQYSPSAMQPQISPSDAYRHFPGQHQVNMDADMYLQPTNNNSPYIRDKPLQRNIHEHDSGKLQAPLGSSNSVTTLLLPSPELSTLLAHLQ